MLLTHDRLPRSDRLEALKFCLVGAGGYAVNACAFALSVALGSQELIAATAAFGAAVAVNFWCNRRWTFPARDGAAGAQAARFLLVSLGAFAFGAAILELLSGPANVPALPAQAASVVAATPLNFLGNKAWSFAT
jgi:putative flippase GtrA